jgi:hypothetical protein
MTNLTKFWLVDVLSAPIIIALIFIVISVLSTIWALALRTFKKIPWRYMWIFVSSFFSAFKKMWNSIFPRLWLREFNKQKKEDEKSD